MDYSARSSKWDESQFQQFLSAINRVAASGESGQPGQRAEQREAAGEAPAPAPAAKTTLHGELLSSLKNMFAAIATSITSLMKKDIEESVEMTAEMTQKQPARMTQQWVSESARYGISRSDKEIEDYLDAQRRVADRQLRSFRRQKEQTGVLPNYVYDVIDNVSDTFWNTQRGTKSYWDKKRDNDLYQNQRLHGR